MDVQKPFIDQLVGQGRKYLSGSRDVPATGMQGAEGQQALHLTAAEWAVRHGLEGWNTGRGHANPGLVLFTTGIDT